MTFQFMCPQGHLLQGEPSQAGQQVQCPTCSVVFIVPAAAQPAAPMAAPMAHPVAAVPPVAQAAQAPAEPADSVDPFLNIGPGGRARSHVDEFAGGGGSEPKMVHIPCPAGHILETSQDSMGQTVMCPHCGEMFELLMKNTLEFKRDKQRIEEKKFRRTSELWMRWAIAAAVLVVIGLIAIVATLKG